mgnify:CR=1 FL=1
MVAATGAVALVIAPLVKSHGLDYLVAAVILAGIFQVILGLSGVAKLMRFIPRSVMVGFVNALAILIFLSQLPELIGVPWLTVTFYGGDIQQGIVNGFLHQLGLPEGTVKSRINRGRLELARQIRRIGRGGRRGWRLLRRRP